MKQYIDLLKAIKKDGVVKPAAREGMPSTLSLFGYQYRCNLQDGFPIHTTKKMKFKNIAAELLWFLKGDKNIKYLINNGCNIWNEDAYNYYLKISKNCIDILGFGDFITAIKNNSVLIYENNSYTNGLPENYKIGDCPLGYDLWRNFNGVDQIVEIIKGLKNNPESRRHLLTSYDPSMTDFALFPCHVIAQFNCRPLTLNQRMEYYGLSQEDYYEISEKGLVDEFMPTKYYLDCQLYQRSCDVFLGVPYNTASYALLTHILAKITGMIAGDFIHSFGDVHIYENYKDAVETQLSRSPTKLPKLAIDPCFDTHITQWELGDVWSTSEMISSLSVNWFILNDYNPQPSIKAELSTGLKK